MSVELLDNTRRISRLIQTNTENIIDFSRLCEVLSAARGEDESRS